ncbi:hypothetical protein B5S43_05505 [Gilliamella apicola]|uniref:hypothetical protein n=1 Tax=Gilliamella apicola TaxID=1196095 RepID=UPI000A345B62|nr:hypothetical protein [Gilliamella apicola]OTQ04147.1 hypothetical protein B5S43_05505 [Gilliamella apicola]OTQ20860.1 hypothetical protein B6D22_10830 [Gilliamella apicola]
MAVCNFPQTSSPIGQASTSCLQRFTIHFRRPAKLKQNKNAPYKGEYGFDWLRDEYIYPIQKVAYDEVILKQTIDKFVELCIDHKDLKLEYMNEDITNPIKPHCQDYYPAWLSIFASKVKGENADAGSEMHKDGVYLDLQLDEIDTIIPDDTKIIFKPSDPCLKITPKKISIKKFLKTSIKKRPINSDTNNKQEISYYLLENAVKIMCQGGTLKKPGKINVIAKLGQCKSEVGQLMVYENDKIGKANIVVVNVITKDTNNQKVIPQTHPSLNDLYNNQSFNQAMIKVNIKVTENFDLVALYNKTKDKDIIDFLNDILDTNYITSQKPDPNNPLETIYASSDIKRRLIDLYQKYGKNTPKDNKKIHDEGHYNTYLLFIDVKPTSKGASTTLGSADLRKDNTKYEWGNIFVIYKKGLTDEHTIVHEAAHTFTLPHTFESFLDYKKNPTLNNKYRFHRGYTENYMDYAQHVDLSQNNKVGKNKYYRQMYSFFKWQWKLMRDDKKSIEL